MEIVVLLVVEIMEAVLGKSNGMNRATIWVVIQGMKNSIQIQIQILIILVMECK